MLAYMRCHLILEKLSQFRYILLALAQRWQKEWKDIDAIIEILPKSPVLTISSRLRLVAATIRVCSFNISLPPTRSKVPFSKQAHNLACVSRLRSPTSSKKSVPPLASSTLPSLRETALVKAPFHDQRVHYRSTPETGAPQLTCIKGPLLLAPLFVVTSARPIPYPHPFRP